MKKLKLAFLTPIVHGHANVQFTIITYLLTEPRTDDLYLDIHIISDEPQRKRLSTLPSSPHASLTFHAMGDEDIHQAFHNGSVMRAPPLSLAYENGIRMLHIVPEIIHPPPSTFISRVHRTAQVLQNVRPDIFVVDVIIHAIGLDAANKAGVPHVVIGPTASLDLCAVTQPGGRGFWKYPFFATRHIFPVPLHLIPFNILYAVIFIVYLLLHPKRRRLDAARNEAGISGSVLSTVGETARMTILASLPELEYPHVPAPRTVFAGPVLTPTTPVSKETYPDIAAFLDGGRTIVINLGSLFSYTERDVCAVVDAIVLARARLQDRGGFQVLWKLRERDQYDQLIQDRLGKDTEGVRIETWIEPPALAVLQHPNLIVAVHHGGANSLIEATYSGVPSIILPVWFDLYTLALRAEWLGNGIYANKGVEPYIDGPLFADAIVRTLRDREDEEGYQMKMKATELAKICKKERGDRKAGEAIVAAAMGQAIV